MKRKVLTALALYLAPGAAGKSRSVHASRRNRLRIKKAVRITAFCILGFLFCRLISALMWAAYYAGIPM